MSSLFNTPRSWLRSAAAAALLVLPLAASAGVLPDDRADALYHRYEGGGVTIQGPSVLVRKKLAEKYAVSANYYQDMITSASIDVEVSGASEYKEERDQYSLGFEYLRGKTTYNLGYTSSEENDYEAQTASFGLSQDLFGDLTTISMGFSRGKDKVRNSTDPGFERDIDRWSYRVGVSQILTKSFIGTLNFEVITDEGFLNNPYRSYRYINPNDTRLFVLEQELYPRTRTSNAVAINGRYFLPYRAAVYGGYRFFTDTWGIVADTFEVGYVHPIKPQWTLEARVRYYKQDNADFYADLFGRSNQQNFMARDKELSTFNSMAFRIGASYEFAQTGWRFVKKGSLNLFYDRIEFRYDDFRDARFSRLATSDPNFRAAGSEPMYEFGANVIQAFVSIWF
ncbi:DUF3570 domain-containing protein [Steroidobacter sp.]|uniref:DUF3570 domain-containing protein n=1 Tax=Steroidobacter sp. TaxID=1978227 RepID=UPI001A437492|nr:DUF3570 domain-containing protein [Steroidobacter sp.]MBL8266155.1 DUF3570 domain-containing protein [Steroidobacter sp.]